MIRALLALALLSACAPTQQSDFPPVNIRPEPKQIATPVQAPATGLPGYGGSTFGQTVILDANGKPIARESFPAVAGSAPTCLTTKINPRPCPDN